jgi:hypothetical protein
MTSPSITPCSWTGIQPIGRNDTIGRRRQLKQILSLLQCVNLDEPSPVQTTPTGQHRIAISAWTMTMAQSRSSPVHLPRVTASKADLHLALIAGAIFICIIAIAAGVGTQYVSSGNPLSIFSSAHSNSGFDGIRQYKTGSIILTPDISGTCQKRLIDNATWKIRDDGFVECDVTLDQAPQNVDRFVAISNSFKAK